MAEHWFRSYHGAPTDPKWILVAKKAGCAPGVVAALWWALMDHASQSTPRGSVDGFDTEVLASFYGFDHEVLERAMAELAARDMIANGMLTAWLARQPKREDDSAERVRRFRAKHSGDDVTHGNARGEENRGEENTTTTPRADKLALYMGVILAEAADRVDEVADQPKTWRASVMALYGPNGSAADVWGSIPESMRPSMLAEAMDALAGEEKRYQAAFFKAILERVIRGGKNGRKGTDGNGSTGTGRTPSASNGTATVTDLNARRRNPFGAGA